MYTKYSRHIALLAILLSTLLYSFSSIKAQDLELHMATTMHIIDPTINEYKKDAARLALSHVASGRSLLDVDVRIPKDIQDSLFIALMHIHDSSNPYAQKVTSMGIHTKAKPYYIGDIQISCTSETTWTEPLIIGATATSSEKINEQLNEYELEIADYDKEENSFEVSARSPLNMSKLALYLSELDKGIQYIIIPEIIETDHDIKAKHVEGNTWIITFQKFSDKKKKEWSFKVDGAGHVSYLGK